MKVTVQRTFLSSRPDGGIRLDDEGEGIQVIECQFATQDSYVPRWATRPRLGRLRPFVADYLALRAYASWLVEARS